MRFSQKNDNAENVVVLSFTPNSELESIFKNLIMKHNKISGNADNAPIDYEKIQNIKMRIVSVKDEGVSKDQLHILFKVMNSIYKIIYDITKEIEKVPTFSQIEFNTNKTGQVKPSYNANSKINGDLDKEGQESELVPIRARRKASEETPGPQLPNAAGAAAARSAVGSPYPRTLPTEAGKDLAKARRNSVAGSPTPLPPLPPAALLPTNAVPNTTPTPADTEAINAFKAAFAATKAANVSEENAISKKSTLDTVLGGLTAKQKKILTTELNQRFVLERNEDAKTRISDQINLLETIAGGGKKRGKKVVSRKKK